MDGNEAWAQMSNQDLEASSKAITIKNKEKKSKTWIVHFFWPHSWHGEVTGPGIEPTLQLHPEP